MTEHSQPGALRSGLAPVVGAHPALLILGNAPSVMSLAAGQYYGNPRNSFWRITAELFGFDAGAAYPERVRALTTHGVAVWDVLRAFRRPGSLDAAIDRNSMVPNDFGAFFTSHPGIGQVVFNGAAAETNYRRLVGTPAGAQPVRFIRLPSTSPANTVGYPAKLAAWRAALALPGEPVRTALWQAVPASPPGPGR